MSGSRPHEDELFEMFDSLLRKGVAPSVAETTLRERELEKYSGYPPLLDLRLEALATAVARYHEALNAVSYLQKRAIRLGRERWYVGPQPDAVFWNALRADMAGRGRTDAEIALVDRDSTAVLGLLDNPFKSAFKTKGLVVGHVQSGKTGNMAAVIAKAAETQFKFFLVMSGMTDQLRSQTQRRLDRDIVAANPNRWMQWTVSDTPEAKGEFKHSAQGGFSFDQRNQLAVVKKNKWILTKLLAKLRNTDKATLAHTPFLIIDDECDHASVNSARYDHEMTEINRCIRELVGFLPRVAYVGYTATPFANVLIDTRVEDDLYPRDFIYALERPAKYFGAQELFGRSALEGEYADVDGLDVIRTVPSADAAALVPRPKTVPFQGPTVPKSLDTALRYFLLTCAARIVRGQHAEHFTMLVHTSVRDSIHRATEAVLRPHLQQLSARLSQGDTVLFTELGTLWGEEQEKLPSDTFQHPPLSFDSLRPHLASVAGSLVVHVENWRSTERLDYTAPGRRYVVIGGNVLARGLTLEGLVVSYFLRSASQYDTLMQMGRWFGFREGFEDLPRVWVEDRARDMFYDLAAVEAEVRREIQRYADEEITPSDFAVKIRRIPGMTITSRTKMRHAVDVDIGFAGEHVQTFRFRRNDSEWLDANWNAAVALLNAIPRESVVAELPNCFVNVDGRLVKSFLGAYKAHETHRYWQNGLLETYIAKALVAEQGTQLVPWSVAVVSGDAGTSQRTLGVLGTVKTVRRSAEKSEGAHDGDVSIKALMSRRDVLADVVTGAEHVAGDQTWEQLKRYRNERNLGPLLLLYPIDAQSTPMPGAQRSREPLAAARDVLGVGIVFPGRKGEAKGYVRANLSPEEPIEDLVEGDAIPEALFTAEAPEGGV